MPRRRRTPADGRFYLDGWSLVFLTRYRQEPGTCWHAVASAEVYAVPPPDRKSGRRPVVEEGGLSRPVTIN